MNICMGDKMAKCSAEGSINPHTMKKAEMLVFLTGRCKHGHKYFAHPACFNREQKHIPRIGYLDIETSNLDANYGIILTYCIKVRDEDKIYKGVIDTEELKEGKFDKSLCKQLIKDMLKFDVIMGYWSTGFDIPFIRARCLKWHLNFPIYKSIEHKDIYYMVKRLMKLNRRSLEVATKHLGIKGKNHVLGDAWMKAVMCTGEIQKKALDYILEHNIRDVEITEKLHKRLESYDRGLTKSI